jgi:hypothetical protein
MLHYIILVSNSELYPFIPAERCQYYADCGNNKYDEKQKGQNAHEEDISFNKIMCHDFFLL